jgi:hypothetical protein
MKQMDYNDTKQHKNFSTWLRESQLELDRVSLTSRWVTVHRLINDISTEHALFLVQYLYGYSPSAEDLEWFQSEFQTDDDMFVMDESDNKKELLNLASIIITLMLEDVQGKPFEEQFYSVFGTYILAVNLLGLRKLHSKMPIVEMAKNVVDNYAKEARKRGSLPEDEQSNWEQKKIEASIEAIDIGDGESIAASIKCLAGVAQNSITTLRKNNNKLNLFIKDLISVQDEELNILWWLINGYSSTEDCAFSEMSADDKSMFLAIELAEQTAFNVEVPSINILFKKSGIKQDEEKSLKDFIDSISSVESISKIEVEVEDIHTPILYAIKQRVSLGDANWFEESIPKLNLTLDDKKTYLDWATHVYREVLLNKALAVYL